MEIWGSYNLKRIRRVLQTNSGSVITSVQVMKKSLYLSNLVLLELFFVKVWVFINNIICIISGESKYE